MEGIFDLIVINPPLDAPNDDFIALFGKLGGMASENASILIFADWQNSFRIQSIASRKTSWNQHGEMIWRKKAGFEKIMLYSPGNPRKARMKPDSWDDGKPGIHPRHIPLPMASDIVLGYSGENGAILDCFAGSGSFALAAKRLNRSYLGFEASPEWHESIMEMVRNDQILPAGNSMEPEIF